MVMNTAAIIDRAELAGGLERLGLEPSDRVLDGFERYASLLLKWNKVYNLTAIRRPEEVLTHHLLDSAALAPALRRFAPEADAVLDVGCGGGLPSVPLALLRPDVAVTGVDAVGKKAAFVNQAAIELGLRNLQARHARIEKLGGAWGVITSRAFASLADFTRLTTHLLAPGGCWLAMKGVIPEDEIAALPAGIRVSAIETLDVPGLAEERHLIVLVRD